ncbi:hypothetical protein [uncultured Chryseobacterium sp.]|uniref:hypothetical protein n=1 Tax=uncultured Chryseobacterium sp. TaxID=259322 RepID=UPI002587866B|nr:hypothetical protein [uncultured Chryseobacterium sp.]
MRIVVYGIIMLTTFSCKAQEKVTLSYVSHQYNKTHNKSFLNNELTFLKGKDTLKVNIKVPFDETNAQIVNQGIFYNCHLKKDTLYTFTLKKVCITDIPEGFSSYYKTNMIPDKKDCSKLVEIQKNTEYKYSGNYGKYVDINRVLYEITGITPDDSCFFPH